ncbi:MAG: hypothetical protein ACQXXF_07885 [Thermoplasmatota archaeon]|jgi:hypothetical protein
MPPRRAIKVPWNDATIFDNGRDAEEFFNDQLLDDLFEQVVEDIQSDAFDEMAVVSNVQIIFKSEFSSPELIFL